MLRENRYLMMLERGYRELFDDPMRRMTQGIFLHSPAGIAWLADSILGAQLGFLEWLDAGADVLTLRYEDICADQPAAFRRMAEFLGVALPHPAVAAAPRGDDVAADVLAAFQERRAAFAPILDRFDYGTEPRA